mgnify:CR=1 FL=1|jgi:hypothetical protein
MSKHRYVTGLLLTSALCMALVGCGPSGPPVGQVTGVVTVDGAPVEGVLVTFVPGSNDQGSSTDGYTDADGRYELQYAKDVMGAAPGVNTVQVTWPPGVEATAKIPQDWGLKSQNTFDVKEGEDNVHDIKITNN